ncbi:class I SAM-dependent methyltransferase [bacterium]|nr:class I SAM-dependent methyltransferase [bacterium]
MKSKYSDITVNNPNPIKRYLHRVRFRHILLIIKQIHKGYAGKILDYGSGDGELCKMISNILPNARIFSYDPSPDMRQQAIDNLKKYNNVKVIDAITIDDVGTFDYIFCAGVLEHLRENDLKNALDNIRKLATANSKIVFEIPNEIYIAALIKGLFRITQRSNEIDVKPSNILKASMGIQLAERPVGQISEGISYIFRHIGFDYRILIEKLSTRFNVERIYGSPLPGLPLFINLEIYVVCQKK